MLSKTLLCISALVAATAMAQSATCSGLACGPTQSCQILGNQPVCADDCSLKRCSRDKTCVLKPVRRCAKNGPCPPVSKCVRNELLKCPPCVGGQRCDVVNGVPTCVSEFACRNGQCGPTQTCQSIDNQQICADDCAKTKCAADEECTLQKLQCFESPCPPVATCEKKKQLECPPCIGGTHCETVNGVPTCVSDMACRNGQCGPTQTCQTIDNQQICADDCAKTKCAADEECTLRNVQCFESPCPPVAQCEKKKLECPPCLGGQRCDVINGVPTCVSEYACRNGQCSATQSCRNMNNEKICVDDCAKIKCGAGKKCVMKKLQCFEFCPPVHECVPL